MGLLETINIFKTLQTRDFAKKREVKILKKERRVKHLMDCNKLEI